MTIRDKSGGNNSSGTGGTPSQAFAYVSDVEAIYLLSLIGGLYDTAGFLKLQGVFTSSITGNLVAACASISSTKGVICRSLIVVSFLVSGAISSSIVLSSKLVADLNPRRISCILFSLELLFMIAVWIGGSILNDRISAATTLDEWPVILIASLMGAAMGFHNVAAKETIPNCPATTVMTLTLVSVATNASNSVGYRIAASQLKSSSNESQRGDIEEDTTMVSPRNDVGNGGESARIRVAKEKQLDSQTKLLSSGKPLICFLIGGLIGAATAKYGSFAFNAIPVAVVLFLLFNIAMKELGEMRAQAPVIAVVSAATGLPSYKNVV